MVSSPMAVEVSPLAILLEPIAVEKGPLALVSCPVATEAFPLATPEVDDPHLRHVLPIGGVGGGGGWEHLQSFAGQFGGLWLQFWLHHASVTVRDME